MQFAFCFLLPCVLPFFPSCHFHNHGFVISFVILVFFFLNFVISNLSPGFIRDSSAIHWDFDDFQTSSFLFINCSYSKFLHRTGVMVAMVARSAACHWWTSRLHAAAPLVVGPASRVDHCSGKIWRYQEVRISPQIGSMIAMPWPRLTKPSSFDDGNWSLDRRTDVWFG